MKIVKPLTILAYDNHRILKSFETKLALETLKKYFTLLCLFALDFIVSKLTLSSNKYLKEKAKELNLGIICKVKE